MKGIYENPNAPNQERYISTCEKIYTNKTVQKSTQLIKQSISQQRRQQTRSEMEGDTQNKPEEEMGMQEDEDVPMDDDGDSSFEDIEEDGSKETTSAATSSSDKGKKKSKIRKTYLPGMEVKDGEKLICEESAYLTLHTFTTSAPCLSFDTIPDNLGDNRTGFPVTAYAISGTQAQRSHANNLMIMKMSNVYKTQPKSSDDELSSDESEDEELTDEQLMKKPELTVALLPHHGVINRVRFKFVGDKPFAASWSELGKVCIWDLTIPLTALDDVQKLQEYIKLKNKPRPIFEFKGHRGEGFAMDWSHMEPGVLATGDTTKFIHIWKPHESTWIVDQRPFSGHSGSVEDIQWSPNEPSVFASCSVDKTIRIWDTRAKPNKGSLVTKENAHENDINVIHWNRRDTFIASGGDDCALKIWDLRTFGKGDPVAEFRHHHKAPICSVEWSPHESTVLATAGEDDQIAIWDLAVERDPEATSEDDVDVPPQLMFVHQGQQDIKEVHWHPQIPGLLLSTAGDGFNVFKPSNM